MALDPDDWTISVTGDIRWTGSGTATNVTVLELHRFAQDLADDEVAVAASNDLLEITSLTPTDRATDNIITLINGYNIDDTAAQHIFDGSITQDGGDTKYQGLVVVGAVETGTQIQIVQNNALLTSYWSTGLNPDAGANILLRIMVKTRQDGADINGRRLLVWAREYGDTYAEFQVTMADGNNTAALFTGGDLNNATASGTVATYDQFNNTEGYQLLDVTAAGSQEPFYSQWTVTGGGSTPASPEINDLYEWAKYVQRRGTAETIHGMNGDLFRGIDIDINYNTEAGDEAPATNDDYCWGAFLDVGTVTGGPYTVGEKITGGTSGAIGRLLSFDATNESLVVDTESGTWQSGEVLTGFTSTATSTTSAGPVGQATGGGCGTILAVLDSGTTGTFWLQTIKGSAPAASAIMYKDGAGNHDDVATVNGTPTARPISNSYIGVSTGSAIIGAFGIGIDPDDLTASDLLLDLENVSAPPPNNVTFTVSGLVSGEDRVLVGPEAAGILELDQDTINDVGLNTSGVTSVTVTTAIPSDTPASGTIRIELDDGRYKRVSYTSYTGSVYTIPSTDFTSPENATTGNNVFISYIDELASGTTATFTSVFSSTRDLFVRARDGGTAGDLEGIKTFETPADLTSTGGGATVIRTPDV